MSSIIDSLFGLDIQFIPNREMGKEYASALNDVLNAEDTIRERFSPEQWALVTVYVNEIHKLYELDYRSQFERGFFLGAKLMTEVMSRDMEKRKNT